MGERPRLAPRETFLEILKWVPIVTFDPIIKYGDHGVVLVKRKIEPYKDVWALPGLRKLKGESLDETLERIVKDELGLVINSKKRRFVGQFVGQFQEENQREDLSTCYVFQASPDQKIVINPNHFSEYMILSPDATLPEPIGEMYRFFLQEYRKL